MIHLIGGIMPRSRSNLIEGWGINDADYVVKVQEDFYVNGSRKRKLLWECPYYKVWKSMIQRVKSLNFRNKRPTYEGCTVCEEWKHFSKFKAWMETQDWEGRHLDKDLLIKGNRLYSANTCLFVKPLTNTFINEQPRKGGNLPIGVKFCKRTS